MAVPTKTYSMYYKKIYNNLIIAKRHKPVSVSRSCLFAIYRIPISGFVQAALPLRSSGQDAVIFHSSPHGVTLYFTAPAVMPSINCFDARKNNMIIGKEDSVSPANSILKSVEYCPNKDSMPTGIVFFKSS
jgi:hypothetical protein